MDSLISFGDSILRIASSFFDAAFNGNWFALVAVVIGVLSVGMIYNDDSLDSLGRTLKSSGLTVIEKIIGSITFFKLSACALVILVTTGLWGHLTTWGLYSVLDWLTLLLGMVLYAGVFAVVGTVVASIMKAAKKTTAKVAATFGASFHFAWNGFVCIVTLFSVRNESLAPLLQFAWEEPVAYGIYYIGIMFLLSLLVAYLAATWERATEPKLIEPDAVEAPKE